MQIQQVFSYNMATTS